MITMECISLGFKKVRQILAVCCSHRIKDGRTYHVPGFVNKIPPCTFINLFRVVKYQLPQVLLYPCPKMFYAIKLARILDDVQREEVLRDELSCFGVDVGGGIVDD